MIKMKPKVTAVVTKSPVGNAMSNAERQRKFKALRKAMAERECMGGLTWEAFVAETEAAHG